MKLTQLAVDAIEGFLLLFGLLPLYREQFQVASFQIDQLIDDATKVSLLRFIKGRPIGFSAMHLFGYTSNLGLQFQLCCLAFLDAGPGCRSDSLGFRRGPVSPLCVKSHQF
jgi:hypothetical protein